MAKKVSSGKRKQLKEHPRKRQQKIAPTTRQQDEKEPDPFDFGGLPSRDLKKNLGCG